MIKCKYCERVCFHAKGLKIHVKMFHKNISGLELEKYYLKERFNLRDDDFNIILKDYNNKNCLSVLDLNKKYNAQLINFLKLSDVKIRSIKEINLDEISLRKMREYWIKKYGVDNPSKDNKVKAKKIKTHLLNYGTVNNFCDDEIGKKARNNVDREKLWETLKKSLIKNFGVDNPAKIPGVNKKISKSQKKRFSLMTEEERRKGTEFMRSCIKLESKIQLRVQDILNQLGITYTSNAFLYSYNFDFLIKGKKILEIQGDFWHANPNKYKANDILMTGFIVKDVWNKDKRKKEIVERNGFKIFYLWENEINKMSDNDIKYFLVTTFL